MKLSCCFKANYADFFVVIAKEGTMRLLSICVLLAAFSTASATDKKIKEVAKPAPATKACTTCDSSDEGDARHGVLHKMKKRLGWYDTGCDQPLGCDNTYTTCKFMFGSCKTFFGNGTASQGHGKRTVVAE
jgi:hypothetical protein